MPWIKHSIICSGLIVTLAACQAMPAQETAKTKLPVQVYQTPAPSSAGSSEQAAPSTAAAATTRQTALTQYFGATQRPSPPVSRRGAPYDYSKDGVDLNFAGTDVREVVDIILGDLLKRDYSIDPAVQGQVTLRTGRPVTLGSLLPALETTLADVGAALLDRGDRYDVVPRNQLRTGSLPFKAQPKPGSPRPAGYALEIFPLDYSLATEVEQILRPIASDGSIVQVSDRHGHIILAGSSAERENLARLITAFDVDWLENKAFALYRLDHVQPAALIDTLEDVLDLKQTNTQQRLIALPRMKAVLGVAADRRRLRQIDSWVRRLDVPAETGERRLHLYAVQNVDAVQLAATLQKVLGFESEDTTAATPSTETPSQNQTNVRSETRLEAGQTQPASGQSQPRVIANEQSNALMIYATNEEFRKLKDTLELMDVFTQQVMIEAVLAEVTLNDDLNYGLQWSFDNDDVTISLSSADNGAVASQFPGFSVLYSGTSDVRAVLNAIQSVTDLKVLSSPKLLVLNNQTASLQVGDQVPIVTQQSQGVIDDNAPVINTVELRDTGVILEVTPRISESGLVFIEINQEVSDVAETTTSGIDSPTIQQRQLKTTIGIQDGNTIALGGLIRETKTRTNSGIPLLKDIPIAGNLFKSNTQVNRRTELVILLTPRIVRDLSSAQDMTTKLLEDFDGLDAQIIPQPKS